ncbi:MAG: hypothetical protein ACK4M2_01520 [Brevundimonas sp.]
MTGLDPLPDRHPRFLAWIHHYRRHGVPLKFLAHVFDTTVGDLVEAGVEP